MLEWTDLICLLRCSDLLKALTQESHLKGFSSVSSSSVGFSDDGVEDFVEGWDAEGMSGLLNAGLMNATDESDFRLLVIDVLMAVEASLTEFLLVNFTVCCFSFWLSHVWIA